MKPWLTVIYGGALVGAFTLGVLIGGVFSGL